MKAVKVTNFCSNAFEQKFEQKLVTYKAYLYTM